MQVAYRNNFDRDLRRIRNRSIRVRIQAAIEQVKAANDLTEIRNIRKLHGGNHFRIRVGNYRLGFRLENDTVVFTRCLLRRDFYQRFP